MARKLQISLDVDSKSGVVSINKVTDSVKNLEKQSDKSSTTISKSFSKIKVGIAAAAAAVALFSAKSLAMSSDLEETQGKFDVVFRGMRDSAEEWAKGLQSSYAMSQIESKKYLSSLQDLLVPTGLARDKAGELSNAFVKMAADLGSFNNRSTEDVILDIQSALQGSSETMAEYGIYVKAAKVEQEVLRLGLASTKKEITESDKAMAIYSITMREGADAVGDMARTKQSYANQLKKFKANIADITTAFGDKLLPIMTDVITKFNELYEAYNDIIKLKYEIAIQNVSKALASVLSIISRYLQLLFNSFPTIFNRIREGIWEMYDDILNGPIRGINLLITNINKLKKEKISLIPEVGGGPNGLKSRLEDARRDVENNVKVITDVFTKPLGQGSEFERSLYGVIYKITESASDLQQISYEVDKVNAAINDNTTSNNNNVMSEEDKKKAIEDSIKAIKEVKDEYNSLTMVTLDYELLKVDEWFNEQAKAIGKVTPELQKLYELKKSMLKVDEAMAKNYENSMQKFYDDMDSSAAARAAEEANANYEKMKQKQDAIKKYKDEVIKKEIEAEKEKQKIIDDILLAGAEKISTGLTDALEDWIDGTKKAGDAFREFAASFLREIAKMIIQQTIFNALKSAVSGVSFGGGGSFDPFSMIAFADGGKITGGFKAFASGGKATEPTLGLIGEGRYNEAVVPLPDGNSIPVKMKGGGSGASINITNNVTVEGGGTDEENKKTGNIISQIITTKVRDILIQEKRYGGILYAGGR